MEFQENIGSAAAHQPLRRLLSAGAAIALVGGLILAGSNDATTQPVSAEDIATTDGLHFAAFRTPAGAHALTIDAAATLIDWPQNNRDRSAGIRIGMIDGGVNVGHPALAGQNIQTRDFRANRSLPAPMDHGTGVAALLVGNPQSDEFRGLLPNASLFAANIFSQDANGRIRGNVAAFMAAVDWLIAMDVSVINVSLTGQDNAIIAQAVEKALDHGILVVAAAGNNRGVGGRDFPAAYAGVLAATAVDANMNIYRHASLGAHVDFAAPGVALRMAANTGSHVQSGTSFASPFLTAAVAVSIATGDRADADAVRRTFGANSQDLGQRGVDHVFGRGLIDCEIVELPGVQVSDRRPSSAPANPRRIGRN